jgi:hypothetical protein
VSISNAFGPRARAFRLQASEPDAAQVLIGNPPMDLQGASRRMPSWPFTMWVFITHIELYDFWFPLGLDHGPDVCR